MIEVLQGLTPALSDVPLTIFVVFVVAGIVYKVLAGSSKSNDQLYKLLERNTVAFDKLETAITAQTTAQREMADNSSEQLDLVRREVISELRLTEARLLVAIREGRDGKTIVADRVPNGNTEIRG